MVKRIILCADDYGQNSAISQAIIHLFQMKRLSATSCLTTSKEWLFFAENLRSYKDTADVGLHFNLTEGKPLSGLGSFFSLNELIIKSHLGLLKQSLIETELQHQLDRFEEGIDRAPDFMDGHQHIHQLPQVRDALLQVYKNRFPDKKCYIRNVTMPLWVDRFKGNARLKRLIIQLCGTRIFQKQLTELGIPHNTSFSGIYNFNYGNRYPQIFPYFLKEINHQGIIMCHPGYLAVSENDRIVQSRNDELQYFLSEPFLQDCQLNRVQLGRFNQ